MDTIKLRSYTNTNDPTDEQAYSNFSREYFSTYQGLNLKLATRALTLYPDPPVPLYSQIWRRWKNQIELFTPDNFAIQAKISDLENGYRQLTRQIEQLPGNPISNWMEHRGEIDHMMMELLKLRRQLASASGLPTYLDYRWRELNRFDYSIGDYQTFHRQVELLIVPVVKKLRADKTQWPYPPEISNTTLLMDGIERILNQVDKAFSDLFHEMRSGYIDLGSRPGKAYTNEQWFFPQTGMPYLHIASNDPGALFHECGHAAHEYLSFKKLHSLWTFSGPEEFQEFVAMSMDMLCWPYEIEYSGFYTADDWKAIQHSTLHLYLDLLTNCVMEDAFQHWIYGKAPEDITPADLDQKWLELKQRYFPWEIAHLSEEEAKTGWQRGNWSLFRIPLYAIAYAIAVVGACQLGKLAEINRETVIINYKAALMLGFTQTLPDLFHVAGVKFPFTPQMVEETLQFILDHLTKITKV